MSRWERHAASLAWSLFALFVVFVLGILVLVAAGRGGNDVFILAALGYPLVGALVASREPDNAVGWLLLTIGATLALGGLLDTYLRSGTPAGADVAAWLSEWSWVVWLSLAGIFLPLVFPDGRLVSRRWRIVLWLAGLTLAGSLVATAFAPGAFDVDTSRPVDNPLGIAALESQLAALETLTNVLAAACFVLAGLSLVVRFRRARGVERQQLKWFAYVALLALAGLVCAMTQVLAGRQDNREVTDWVDVLGAAGWFTALATIMIGIPIATGMAILRHRLYDIDVVIRRTLVYGGVTATLVAGYVCSVLLLQLVLSPGSDLAIAGSTLAVAALFRPAVARIQEFVDRRFYRRRYDAAKTVGRFGARLRDEVALQSLSAELRDVVRETMQPAHVSLWLRERGRG